MINSGGDYRGHRRVPGPVLVDLRGSIPCIVVDNRISLCGMVHLCVIENVHRR